MSQPSIGTDVKREDAEVRKELAASEADEERTKRLAEEQPEGSLLDTNVLWTIGKEVAGKIIDIFLTQFFKFINYFLKKVEADFAATLSPDSKSEYETSKSLLASVDRVMRTREFQDRLGAVITHLGEIVQPLIDEMIILMDREGAAFGNTAYGVSQTIAFNFMMGLSDGIQGALALIPGVGTILDALDILRTILNSGTVMTVAAIQATTVLVTTILGTFDRTAHPIVQMLEELQGLFEMIANARETVEKGINEKAQELAKRIAPVHDDKTPVQEQEKQVKREQTQIRREQAQIDKEATQIKKQEQAEEKRSDEQQLRTVDTQISDTQAELEKDKKALVERQAVTGGKRGGAGRDSSRQELGPSVEELTARIRRLQKQLSGYENVRQGLKDKLRELVRQTLGQIPSREQVVKHVQDQAVAGIASAFLPAPRSKTGGGKGTKKLRKRRRSRRKMRHPSKKSKKFNRRFIKSRRRR
jgi:hypothetical protein